MLAAAFGSIYHDLGLDIPSTFPVIGRPFGFEVRRFRGCWSGYSMEPFVQHLLPCRAQCHRLRATYDFITLRSAFASFLTAISISAGV